MKILRSLRTEKKARNLPISLCLPTVMLSLVLFGTTQAKTVTRVVNSRVQERAPVVKGVPKVAIGTRYKIEGWIVATKTFDGVSDNVIEVEGGASFLNTLKDGPKNVTLCDLKKPKEMSAGGKIKFGTVFADQTIFDPHSDNYAIGGSFYDVDGNGTLTTLFVGNKFGSLSSDSKKGELTLYGNYDNANIDIVYSITVVKTLFLDTK